LGVKSKSTKIEISLGKALWARGIRYRKNDKTVFGTPDFTIKKYKFAIFADGEFWHGKNWDVRKFDHKSNKEFWISKIERNMERDKEVNRHLISSNWKVFRFWGNEIKKDVQHCASIIENAILEISNIS